MKNERNSLQNQSELKIIYALLIGQDHNGKNIYHFLLNEETETTWQVGWEQRPACIMRNLTPDEDMYSAIAEIKTDITLDLVQNNCCFSLQDARDRVVAIANENLDHYEQYPENGRIVIHFGDSFEDVAVHLAKRDIPIEIIND